jgi:hypothetical protein
MVEQMQAHCAQDLYQKSIQETFAIDRFSTRFGPNSPEARLQVAKEKVVFA